MARKFNYAYSIGALFILLFLTACDSQQKNQIPADAFKYSSTHQIATDSGYYPGMRIINPSDSSVDLRFSINNKFWFTPEGMMEYIRGMKADSLPQTDRIISNAFWFVVNNTRHRSQVPLPKQHEFSPGTMINSIGFGICSNRAAMLAIVWKKLGFKSRCIHLGGHVVPEVYDQGKWKMIDPDYNAYFIKEGKIASVDEIAGGVTQCSPVFGRGMQNIFNEAMPQYYETLFTTRDNNKEDPWYIENISWEATHFTLPPGAELAFPAENPGAAKNSPHMFACLKIHRPFRGLLNIPFAIHSVRGKGQLINLYESRKDTINQKTFYSPGIYMIEADSLDLYLYINPLLLANNDSINEIKIFSNKINVLEFIPGSYPKNEITYIWLDRYQDLIKEKMGFYKAAFNADKDYFNDTISIGTLNDFSPAILDFYKKSHHTTTVPDSIIRKVDCSIESMRIHHMEEEKMFGRLGQPFHRNMIMILIIELPCEAMSESFDFFYK